MREVSQQELLEWIAFYSIEPWGEKRADLRAGVIASSVANFAGRTMRKGARARPIDFVQFDRHERVVMSGREMQQIATAYAQAHNRGAA